jgi:hypothetical protein
VYAVACLAIMEAKAAHVDIMETAVVYEVVCLAVMEAKAAHADIMEAAAAYKLVLDAAAAL